MNEEISVAKLIHVTYSADTSIAKLKEKQRDRIISSAEIIVYFCHENLLNFRKFNVKKIHYEDDLDRLNVVNLMVIVGKVIFMLL